MDEGRGLSVLDVREDEERAYRAIPVAPGAIDLHIPLGQVPDRLAEIRAAAAAAHP